MHTKTLTLTPDEQKAINWIGHRYAHGNDLYELLMLCTTEQDEWEWGEQTITFEMPDWAVWELREIILADNLACFGEALSAKLLDAINEGE